MKKHCSFLLGLMWVLPLAATAQTETIVTTCDGTMCSWQRPVVEAPKGWVRDKAAGEELQIAALVPAGESFEKAPAAMYARAAYRPWNPGTLAHFIAGEGQQFRQRFRGAAIRQRGTITDADGRSLQLYEYAAPEGKKDVELVAYGQEGDYFLIFGLRAKSTQALERARPAFTAFVGSYRRNPGKSTRPHSKPMAHVSPDM
jgi:hypothetical protein